MRKICAVILLACLALLPLAGSAQAYLTITQLRESVLGRWTQTYETKWRDIMVDVQPFVPDAEALPILKVVPSFEVPAEAVKATDWEIDLRGDDYRITKEDTVAQKKLDKTETKWVAEYVYDSFDTNKTYESSSLTMGEAIAFLHKVLVTAGMDPERMMLSKPASMMVSTFLDKSTGNPVLPSAMSFKIYQQLYSIPILCHITDCIQQPKDNMLIFYADTSYSIRSTDEFNICIRGLKETEILATDIPLCSFSKIIAAIEEEIQAGHIRKVFDVELGYVLYNEPGATRKPGSEWFKSAVFYAVPTWRVNCLYVSDSKKELRNYEGLDVPERGAMEYTSIAINAQTGKMQNFVSNKDNSDDVAGFISWDQVGGQW